jgi:hypothetical protein
MEGLFVIVLLGSLRFGLTNLSIPNEWHPLHLFIGCIDYLAYGTIFKLRCFVRKKKLDVFFPARKAVDERWAGRAGWGGGVGATKGIIFFAPDFCQERRQSKFNCSVAMFHLEEPYGMVHPSV